MWPCARERGDWVSKDTEKGEGVLAVLVVINHLAVQYPLTLAVFDLDHSKTVVLK